MIDKQFVVTVYLKTIYPRGTEPYAVADGLKHWSSAEFGSLRRNNCRKLMDKLSETSCQFKTPYQFQATYSNSIHQVTLQFDFKVTYSCDLDEEWELDFIEYAGRIFSSYLDADSNVGHDIIDFLYAIS